MQGFGLGSEVLMKKLISAILCLSIVYSLCVPAMAVSKAEKEPELPPGIALTEGGTWIPASEGGIMPREDPNAACGKSGHIPPSDYRYVGVYHGNTDIEATIITVGSFLFTLLVPQFGLVAFIVNLGMQYDAIDSEIRGEYYQYTWRSPDGSVYWYHIVAVADYDHDGYDNYIGCEVRTGNYYG